MGSSETAAHHSVGFNAIDEDGYGSHPLLLHTADQLPNVHLLCDDMLAVEEDCHGGVGGVEAKGPMLNVPLHVLSWAAEEAIVLRVQAAWCTHSTMLQLFLTKLYICLVGYLSIQADDFKATWLV